MAIETQTHRPTAGQLKLLKLAARGTNIYRDWVKQDGNGAAPVLGYFTDHFDRLAIATVKACLDRNWVREIDNKESGACRIEITPDGRRAIQKLENTRYKTYNR